VTATETVLGASDLAAYFARIGYSGPAEPSLSCLAGIIAGHAAAIPFENLDVLLGRPVRLDTAALLDKLVHRRRGGYCFEHNTLLMQVLLALGFAVEGLGARVVWMRAPDEIPPRTHMLLRVLLPAGPHLADVGFGGLTLTAPLRLVADLEQPTPHDPHRLVATGNGQPSDELELQARLGAEWTRLYRFSLEPQYPIDYELANWFTSTYPAGLFTNNLLMALPEPDRRYALFNDAFTVHYLDGRRERREWHGPVELGDILARHFHMMVPPEDLEKVSAAVERAVAAPPKTAG